jgi:hypothetical protein
MKIKRTQRKNKQHNRKTKKGGWPWSPKQTPSDDPLAYKILTKKRPNLPIDDGKRYAELHKIDLRDYPTNPEKYDDDNYDEHRRFRVEDDDDDDEHKIWRDVEDPNVGISDDAYTSFPASEASCTESANNCDLRNIPIPDEQSCSWIGDGLLSGMLSVVNKSEVTNGTELVTVKTDDNKRPIGELDCNLLKSEIEEKFAKMYLYKKCGRFQQITSFKMYGHFFKKNHLSLVSLGFRLFTNLQTITLGIDPESFKLKEGEHECLEKQNNIKFIIQNNDKYGIELVATRGELTGGKKRKTNRKRYKKNKSSKK